MSESPTTSMATPGVVQDASPDVIQAAEPTRVQDAVSHTLVLVTEQEVGFGTAAAIPLRPRKFTRRLIDAIRVVRAAFTPPRDDTTHSTSVISRCCRECSSR